MFDPAPALLAPVLSWVGRPHMNCFQLVRDVYLLAGLELPPDHSEAQTHFVRVWQNAGCFDFQPRAFDVLRIANGTVDGEPLVNHVGVALGTRRDFFHSMEDFGQIISDFARAPWRFRVQSIERWVA